ncbi:hypothetical protein ACIBF1_22265 [Spirillospora sp. NPDC050679]
MSRRRPLGPSAVEAEPPLAPDSVPIARYYGTVRRHFPALLVALILGALFGVVQSATADRTYTATISVLAPPVTLHPGFAAGSKDPTQARRPRDTTMDTEAQLVWSDEVLRRLATFPGFRADRAELKDRITITVPSNTQVLTIGVRAGSPKAAQSGAEIVAETYLNLRQQIMGGVQQRNREALQQTVTLLEKQLKALPGDASQLTRLTARTRRQAIMKQIGAVEKQLSGLEAKAVQPGEVLRGARHPATADDPGRDVKLANGLALGLLGWLLYALLRDRRPRRIRRPADVRLHSRLPIMVEAAAGDAGHREVCRRLRNLVFDAEASTVLVAGVPAAAGAGIAHQLATLCNEGGSATTLLRLHEHGRSTQETAPPRTDFPVRLVRTDDGDRSLSHAIAKAGRESAIVVISAPELDSADTVSAAAASDLTLVVVERGRALDREVARGVLALDKSATPARGIVLTAPEPM